MDPVAPADLILLDKGSRGEGNDPTASVSSKGIAKDMGTTTGQRNAVRGEVLGVSSMILSRMTPEAFW